MWNWHYKWYSVCTNKRSIHSWRLHTEIDRKCKNTRHLTTDCNVISDMERCSHQMNNQNIQRKFIYTVKICFRAQNANDLMRRNAWETKKNNDFYYVENLTALFFPTVSHHLWNKCSFYLSEWYVHLSFRAIHFDEQKMPKWKRKAGFVTLTSKISTLSFIVFNHSFAVRIHARQWDNDFK